MNIALILITAASVLFAVFGLVSRGACARALKSTRSELEAATARLAQVDRNSEALDRKAAQAVSEAESSLAFAIAEFKDLLQKAAAVGDKTTQQREMVLKASKSLDEILADFSAMIAGLDRHACSFDDSSTSIRRLAESTERMQQSADKAIESTRPLAQDSMAGKQAVARTAASMADIAAESREIQEILKKISAIAARTNLLAMNAAIEAAHAGDSGAGFAVVAAEVRNLAENSAVTVKQIESKMREMETKIEAGLHLSTQTEAVFASIARGIDATVAAAEALAAGVSDGRQEIGQVLPEIDALSAHLCELQEQYADRRSGKNAVDSLLGEIQSLSAEIHEAERLLVEQDYVILKALERASASLRPAESESHAG